MNYTLDELNYLLTNLEQKNEELLEKLNTKEHLRNAQQEQLELINKEILVLKEQYSLLTKRYDELYAQKTEALTTNVPKE